MKDKEALDMMRRCVSDIKQLRTERDRLAPAAEAYGMIRHILNLTPQNWASRAYGEDIVWTLEKRIKEIEDADKEVEKS